jgi:hypothetical protein
MPTGRASSRARIFRRRGIAELWLLNYLLLKELSALLAAFWAIKIDGLGFGFWVII